MLLLLFFLSLLVASLIIIFVPMTVMQFLPLFPLFCFNRPKYDCVYMYGISVLGSLLKRHFQSMVVPSALNFYNLPVDLCNRYVACSFGGRN